MTSSTEAVPTQCIYCGNSQIFYKAKASKWECQICEERFLGAPPKVDLRLQRQRSLRPKNIFLSYGHDDNKELVQLFQTALEKRGHTIWIDLKELGAWDDWKGGITRGIDGSELTIAFLSKHALRDPGVCRNEIAIALNRFGTVYPILLESGIDADIPVTIRNLQWPDLSRWRDVRDGKVPGIDWDRWYEEKLLNLIEKLEGEATTFADETSILRKALNPSSFESKVIRHVPGFVGREWVFDDYRQWLKKDSRLFWIKAGPGVGKSAISANLANRERSAIVASWFCDAKSPELKNPMNALRSIAFQLALRWEDYRVKLLRQLQLAGNASEEMCEDARRELEKKNTQDLFRFLLAEPLSNLIWREHKLVIVIDALDEGSGDLGANLITELISTELHSLPDWISFVVTSRPEADVVNRLQGFKAFELDAQDPRNQADLRTWYQANLSQRVELKELLLAKQLAVENLLIERSAGMILYLKVVEEGLKENSLTVDMLEYLDHGLPGLFKLYYDGFHQRFGNDYERAIKPLLRLLLAAGGPLPKDLACNVLQWNSEQFLACRNRLGSYVQENAAGYELFHKTLGEWLDSDTSGPFHLDQSMGRQAIADVLFAEISQNESHTLRWRELIRNWLPAWMTGLLQNNHALSINALGITLNDWADYKSGEALLRRSLILINSALPARLPDIATSLNNLANLLKSTGRYDEAEPLYREALAIRKIVLSGKHPDVASSLNNLASLLESTARYDEAEPLYCEALSMRQATLSVGHPEIAASLHSLAGLFESTGRYHEAEPLYREALAIWKATLPADHPDIATGLNDLAGLLEATGRYNDAEPLYRKALAMRKTALVTGHPSIANTTGSLANLLDSTGRYDEAEALYREALAMEKATLPAGHSAIATSLNNLATLLKFTGRYDEAEALYRETLANLKASLPIGHPNIASSLDNLASLLKSTGRYGEAETLHREALAMFKAALPAGHSAIAISFLNLARLLKSTGCYEEAEVLHRKALVILKAALPVGHPIIASSLDNLAVLLKFAGRYDEAEALHREALAMQTEALPVGHPDIAMNLDNLAGLLKSTGRYDEAEPLHRKALAMLKAALPAGHPLIAVSLDNLASLLRSTGRHNEAEPLCREALAMLKAALPAGHPAIASTLSNLASLLKYTGCFDEAEMLYSEALLMFKATLPAGHPDIAGTLNNLASLFYSVHRYEEAESLFREALTMRRIVFLAGHPDVADSLNGLASLLYSVGRYDDAEALFREALAMRKVALPADHPDIVSSLNNLATLFNSTGRCNKAEPLCREALAIQDARLGI